MGKRFLAVLAVVALGAASAMVGMTMASGQWTTVGQGLEPGMGYAIQLTDKADRLKLELANAQDGAMASFSLYSPEGVRAGHYALDGNTKLVEVVAGKGVWTLFVYKAQGGDLTVGVHGAADAGRFQPADVERREFTLGNVRGSQQVENTYTAIVGKEPVLANVVLEGSARNLVSELRTEKGVVEMISEQEVAAVQGGGVVDHRGERTTFPANLAAGPFTARVQADSLSGTLKLLVLYVEAPDFLPLEAPVAEEEDEEPQEGKKGKDRHAKAPRDRHTHDHHHKHAAPRAMPAPPAMEWADCGTAESRVPYAVEAMRGLMRLTLEETVDPFVTVYTPHDAVLAVVQLEEEGDEATVPLPMAGEYVVYSRGMSVKVELMGTAACSLRELDVEAVAVAVVTGEGVGVESGEVPFEMLLPPLEFGIRMADPLAAGIDVEATFTGPLGEAAHYRQSFNTGAFGSFGGSDWVPLGGLFGQRERPNDPQQGRGPYASLAVSTLA
jgi:hypothetical protein